MTSLIYCQQARELLDSLGEAIREVIKLHEEQFHSLVGVVLDSKRFDPLIHMAYERKHVSKYTYLHNLETLGCSTFDVHDKK